MVTCNNSGLSAEWTLIPASPVPPPPPPPTIFPHQGYKAPPTPSSTTMQPASQNFPSLHVKSSARIISQVHDNQSSIGGKTLSTGTNKYYPHKTIYLSCNIYLSLSHLKYERHLHLQYRHQRGARSRDSWLCWCNGLGLGLTHSAPQPPPGRRVALGWKHHQTESETSRGHSRSRNKAFAWFV